MNIVPIPYGDDYADLPGFLEDMAQIRIRNRIEKHSLIGRTVYQQHDSFADPLLRYHYSQQILPFCGRQRELAQLQEFLCDSEKFLWWSVTGQAGAGKSRLALEFLNQLPTSWFGFFASDKATEKDIEEFKPFAHTVMVIDYVADQALGMSWGARKDAKYNPIMGRGIDEIDEEEALCRMLAAYQPEEPYRREHRKIGANEPCPCGSGKKFKKCCRGNGRYDL